MTQPLLSLINGTPSTDLSVQDRGVAYGDGIFETMRIVYDKNTGSAHIPLFSEHLLRFEAGITRLKLGVVNELLARFNQDVLLALLSVSENAICKVILTRGVGGSGYKPLSVPDGQLITQILNMPDYPGASQFGVSVKTCQTRLAMQPSLAGIKHLDRLEQVLASQELGGEQEGLMLDQNGHVIEGIKSNLLLFEGTKIVTPLLENCGVNGTLRQHLISNADTLGIQIEEGIIDQNRCNNAGGLAMINSVFGCWPVSHLDGDILPVPPLCKTVQAYLKQHLGY